LRNFFKTEWLHHLSVTVLRKGKDSDAFINASRIAQPWIDLLDMASLGEPLPLSHLDTLESSTQEVLASSGIHDDAALEHYQTLINSVSEWTEEIVTTDDTETNAAVSVAPANTNTSTGSIVTEANSVPRIDTPVHAPEMAPSASPQPRTEEAIEDPIQSLRPTEDELKEVTSYTLGCWLQLPKEGGGFQQLKVAWISGISGSIMLVNRRGARVLVLSPPELVALKRRNELLLFEDESPVDQAMAQLLEKLKRQ
ncbi:MAG: DUF1631 family protein, partial [Methylococcales bacterium]